jgi:hypothetical protein
MFIFELTRAEARALAAGLLIAGLALGVWLWW